MNLFSKILLSLFAILLLQACEKSPINTEKSPIGTEKSSAKVEKSPFEIEKEQILQMIKAQYETENDNGDNKVCYFLGNDIKFPYQTVQLDFPENSKQQVWLNNELNRRLSIFQQVGLLNLSKNKQGKQYQLSNLGTPYFYKTKFCLGNISVKKIKYADTAGAAGMSVHVNYQIENIPEWARNELLKKYFTYNVDLASFEKGHAQYKDNKFDFSRASPAPAAWAYVDTSKKGVGAYYIDPDQQNRLTPDIGYYDKELADYLLQKSIQSNDNVSLWGKEIDPIFLQWAYLPKKVILINNVVLMKNFEDSYHPIVVADLMSVSNVRPSNIENFLEEPKGTFFDIQTEFGITGMISRIQKEEARGVIPKRPHHMWQEDRKALQNIVRKDDQGTVYYSDSKNVLNRIVRQNEKNVTLNLKEEANHIDFGGISFEFNEKGQLIQTVDEKNTTKYTYDKQGRLMSAKNADVTCQYTGYNNHGDWTRGHCGVWKKARLLEYVK